MNASWPRSRSPSARPCGPRTLAGRIAAKLVYEVPTRDRRYLVDVREGIVRDLGGVSVATVSGDRARGIVEGQIVVVGPSVPTGVMTPHEPLPDWVTSDGAYLLDRQLRRLSLLPPAA